MRELEFAVVRARDPRADREAEPGAAASILLFARASFVDAKEALENS